MTKQVDVEKLVDIKVSEITRNSLLSDQQKITQTFIEVFTILKQQHDSIKLLSEQLTNLLKLLKSILKESGNIRETYTV